MTFDSIDGVCPNCGTTRMDLLTSGLWDGWSGPDLLPASSVRYTGRCQRCGAILETLLAGDEEPNSAPWSPVDVDHLEAIEWVLGGRPVSPREPHYRPERTVAAWTLRYMLVGAVVGLVLPLFVLPSTIPPVFIMPVFGAVIGSAFGCLAGTFVRWTKRRGREKSVSDDL